MKLYLTQAGRWAGTQAEARQDGSFEQIEVPTDKPGLLDWLNENARKGFSEGSSFAHAERDEADAYQAAHELDYPAAKPTPAPQQPPAQSPNWKADSVMVWVLDEAAPAHIEQLFAALGARFHEAVR